MPLPVPPAMEWHRLKASRLSQYSASRSGGQGGGGGAVQGRLAIKAKRGDCGMSYMTYGVLVRQGAHACGSGEGMMLLHALGCSHCS